MAVVVPGPPALSAELALFHTTDPLLGNSPVLVFHGPASTFGATRSRIQVHVFTPAGNGSYSRLSVSPTSPFYSAVSNLPREEQGDEVCRGLAFGLKKYFSELPEGIRKTWTQQVKTPSPGALFGDDHIAILATRMARIENIDDVVGDIAEAFCEQRLSWMDVDVVLPPGAIREPSVSPGSEEVDDEQLLKQHYGPYAELIASFGDVAFLPTSRMRRAPSKATAIGRSASFARHQKENVRKEMSELLATEESYVGRLGELQGLSGSIGADLKEKYQEQIEEVFSPAIEQILDINRNFLEDVRSVIEGTEAAAEEDIEASEDVDTTTCTVGSPEPTSDLQGVIALAKSLCEWFPRFADGYKEYLGAHAEASQTLRKLLRNGDSLAAELHEVSEQKLTSLLIEPVQRLPRYNLYIDSISRQLPARHPALKPLLKARDIITDICAENQDLEASAVVERLRSRTLGWPTDISVTGRLVTAADYVELMPPLSLEGCDAGRGILLLFTDGIILAEKTGSCKTTARSLITELESGSLPTRSVESLSDTAGDLQFIRRLQLDAVQCTESHDGQALQILTFFELAMGAIAAREPILDSCQEFRLENVYDGRASRLVEEISKARIESRFSEAERESTKWEFRATDPASDSLGLFCAIFDDTEENYKASRNGRAEIRILVDPERHSEKPLMGQDGLRTVVSVEPGRDGNWRVSLDSVDGHIGREHVETADLVPAVRRKLATLASTRLTMEKPSMTACMLGRNLEVLQSIGLQVAPKEGDDGIPQLNPRERVHRPKSPKKLLSSFLSSVGPGAEHPNVLRKESRELMALSTQSSLSRLSTTAPGKPPSRESRPDSGDAASTSFSSVSSEPLGAPIKKLEDTFAAYILALQARKGNIVGKNLKMRLTADEALVNEVYNGLIEDPNMMVLAAQAPLDVLFASFEKFLNVAWRDNIGQILPLNVLQDISLKAESLFPRDFDEYFKAALGGLAPQNQRAFRSIIRLLAELLDGTGNDGDRGTLTACFAEVLITETNPHDYIALLDRFVDDTDTYFGEPVEEPRHTAGSINSHKRARSVNSSSLTSNTSSLRRKFGFSTLSRENSKSEQESKVASVWRTLSKTSRADASPHGSISRATLGRSQSIDDGHHLGTRPLSQDSTKAREHQFTEMPSVPALGRPPSSHNLGLSTIGEHPTFIPTGPPRKKRRSSLSDLKSVETTPKEEPFSPQSPARPSLLHSKTEEKELPRSPPLSTPTSKVTSAKYGTPQASPRSRLPSSFRRDMSPGPSRAISPGPNRSLANTELPRPKTGGGPVEEVVITNRPTSNIPSLVPRASSPTKPPSTPGRTGLSERPGAGNIVKKLSPQADKITRKRSKTDTAVNPLAPPPLTPHRKLRMQSPQKLRERLQNEQSSITAASNALQDELSKIGDELTSTSSLRSPMRGSRTLAARNTFSPPSSMDLAQRVLKMEGQLPKQVEELSSRINTIQSDLSMSLNVSETKCKKLDELYREANAENEALYARFNDELSRVMKAVRGGEGVEELKKKLRESQEEAAKLRRETSRLKRENVGLRAQLKE